MEKSKNEAQGIKIGLKTFITSVAILIALIIISGILTRLVPQGAYQRTIEGGRELILPNSFQFVNNTPYPLWHMLTAPIEVLFSADGPMIITIILFIFAIGGSFSILDNTGVLKAMISKIVARFGKQKYRLLPIIVLFFMLLGAMLGIFEETIPLVPIIVTLSYSLGWDSLMGLGMSILSVAFGFSAAITNPFSIGVAQKIAELPIFSGIPFRILIFLTIYIILVFFLRRYGKKIDRNPEASLVYNEDIPGKKHFEKQNEIVEVNGNVNSALRFLIVSFIIILLVMISSSFLPSISAYSLPIIGLLFLISGIICGVITGVNLSKVMKIFWNGLSGIAPGVIMILLAMSVKFIISNGGIMDTILYYASNQITSAGPYGASILVFLLVLLMEFFIGSSTAKAFLIMPIITPLADLIGMTHQTAVLAFCFGDGFSNIIYPTNAALLISLGLTIVSYPKWFKWTIKLQALIALISMAFILLSVYIKFGPF